MLDDLASLLLSVVRKKCTWLFGSKTQGAVKAIIFISLGCCKKSDVHSLGCIWCRSPACFLIMGLWFASLYTVLILIDGSAVKRKKRWHQLWLLRLGKQWLCPLPFISSFIHSLGCARSYLLPLGLWSLLQHVEFCCGMWDIVPRPGIELVPPALGAQSVCLWTSREAPLLLSEWGIVATFLSFFWALELRRSKERKRMGRAGCTEPGNWVVPGVHPLTWQPAHLRSSLWVGGKVFVIRTLFLGLPSQKTCLWGVASHTSSASTSIQKK